MAKIRVADLVIDFSGARAFVRNIRSGNSATTRGHRRAANRYLSWLQRRYKKYSMGGGDWERLSDETIRRKKQHKNVILVEFMDLYSALGVRRSGENQYTVGIFTKKKARRSNKSLRQIATLHQHGNPETNLPSRPIVVMPSRGLRRGMVADIQKGVDEDIERADRGNR